MSNEIFYLESCLAIEKSIEDVRESVRYIDDDFMFESPKDVFETIKRKILELIRKVKEIFNSVAIRKKNAETVKKAKKVKNGKIKIRNHKKLFELYDNCMKAVKSGKDPKKVKDKWKKGLIILGFTAISGAVIGTSIAIKNKRDEELSAKNIQNALESFRKNMEQRSEELKSEINNLDANQQHLANTKKNIDLLLNKTKEQASTMSEMYSDLSKSVSGLNQDVYTGTEEMCKEYNNESIDTSKHRKIPENNIKSFADVWKEENEKYHKTIDKVLKDNREKMSKEMDSIVNDFIDASNKDTEERLRKFGMSEEKIQEIIQK